MPKKQQPGSSATHDVYERLRADVLASRVRPGARLKIADLCRELDVSLGAVREALSRLSSEGLVVAEPQRGFRVAPISAVELQDLTTVRVEIERLCLGRSIRAGDAAWEVRVRAAFQALSDIPERQPEDPSRLNDAWSTAHQLFHQELVSNCGSLWLLRMRETLFAQSERYRRYSLPASGFKRDTESEHRQIMEAAFARNADLAVALMSSHLFLTTKILLDTGFAEIASPVAQSLRAAE